MTQKYQAILFDLLGALLDSWTVWDKTAGSETMGRTWRAEYLRITRACGKYRPYLTLVAEAARTVGLDPRLAQALEENWRDYKPWPDVRPVVGELARTHRLGVVTNCSETLGQAAAKHVGVPFDVVVTCERAGYYKPEPYPYQLALKEIGCPASRVLYVSGAAFDLIGCTAVGMDAYWHNRLGHARASDCLEPLVESRTLAQLPALALTPM